MQRIALLLAVALALSACRPRGMTLEDIPTLAPPVDVLATQTSLTQNAPPVGYERQVSYESIDQTLRRVEGWRYEVLLEFDGVFSQTTREVSGRAEATVYYNQVSDARRVLVSSQGDLLQRPEGEAFEAVRLGTDAFLVRRGTCLSNVPDDALTAANISAGALVGGVRNAYPVGRQAVVNGQQAWMYQFELTDMLLPAVRFADDTRITEMLGEMWVAPQIDAPVRYWVTLTVENARLLLNDLPVTGQLRLRYDLYDVGTLPNISVPFGC